MEKEVIFSLISTLLLIIGIAPLWRDIIWWRTIPHPFTKWIWLILLSINLYILYANSQFIPMIAPAIMWICLAWECLVGIWKLKKLSMNWFDFLCLTLSFLCLLYLIFFRNLQNAAILTIIVDFIAMLPLFKKWWLQPWTETTWTYFISWVSQLFIILSLDTPSIETMIFWGYILIMDAILVSFILFRRYYLKGWKSIFE